jgi:phosphate transport system permease protein
MSNLTLPVPAELGHELRAEIRRISSRSRARRSLISRIMITLCFTSLLVAAVPLFLLMYQVIKRGVPVLSAAFFTTLPQTPSLINPTVTGGVSNAIIGTLALNIYAAIMAVPVGVFVGIYLAENNNKFASMLRIISQTMSGAPSILMGLFAFTLLVRDFNLGFSAIAGSFALAVLMLPVIIISTEISVLNVPKTLREAGLALGAKEHQVSLKVVLPAALSGIVTGVILALSRSIGETAPILLTIGGGFLNAWGLFGPVSALPLQIYMGSKSEWPAQRAQVWGIALVLVVFVFVLSLSARIWASRKQKVHS